MKEWELVEEKQVYGGYRKVNRRTFKMSDGSTADFDVIQSKSGASVIFALTEENKVVCIKQFRPGPGMFLTELPGGVVEDGEDPKVAIARELKEETGYQADNIQHLGSYFRDAYIDGRWNIYIGTDAKKVAEVDLSEGEAESEVCLLTIDEYKKLLFSGDHTDTTAGYAALNHLDLL